MRGRGWKESMSPSPIRRRAAPCHLSALPALPTEDASASLPTEARSRNARMLVAANAIPPAPPPPNDTVSPSARSGQGSTTGAAHRSAVSSRARSRRPDPRGFARSHPARARPATEATSYLRRRSGANERRRARSRSDRPPRRRLFFSLGGEKKHARHHRGASADSRRGDPPAGTARAFSVSGSSRSAFPHVAPASEALRAVHQAVRAQHHQARDVPSPGGSARLGVAPKTRRGDVRLSVRAATRHRRGAREPVTRVRADQHGDAMRRVRRRIDRADARDRARDAVRARARRQRPPDGAGVVHRRRRLARVFQAQRRDARPRLAAVSRRSGVRGRVLLVPDAEVQMKRVAHEEQRGVPVRRGRAGRARASTNGADQAFFFFSSPLFAFSASPIEDASSIASRLDAHTAGLEASLLDRGATHAQR